MSEPPATDPHLTKRFFGALFAATGLMVFCLSGLCTLFVGLSSLHEVLTSGRFTSLAMAFVYGGPAICIGLLLGIVGLDLMTATAERTPATAAIEVRNRLIRHIAGLFFIACAAVSPLPALAIWTEPIFRPGVSGVIDDAIPALLLGSYLLFSRRARRPRVK